MISNSVRYAIAISIAMGTAQIASAQPAAPSHGASIALESDAFSFFIGGYSVIANLSLRSGFQIAGGVGSYDVPKFLLEGDDSYDTAKWEARVTSLQVFRTGYRFNGPLKNGPALAAVVLNQNWRLSSGPLGGETTFRQLSIGLSGGYYWHIGTHFYVYPTAAFTHNSVSSGGTSINGTNYKVPKFGPNASIHVGWDFGF